MVRFIVILLVLLGFLAVQAFDDNDNDNVNYDECEVVINEINTMGRGTIPKIQTTIAPSRKKKKGKVILETEEYIELKSFCKNHPLSGYKLLGISAG